MSGGSSFPKIFTKAPMGMFFLKKFVKWVSYEKIELKDGKDVEINENLDFVYYDWHGPSNPTTLKNESLGTFEKFVFWD